MLTTIWEIKIEICIRADNDFRFLFSEKLELENKRFDAFPSNLLKRKLSERCLNLNFIVLIQNYFSLIIHCWAVKMEAIHIHSRKTLLGIIIILFVWQFFAPMLTDGFRLMSDLVWFYRISTIVG